MVLTLYHNDMSVCAQKARMVLAYKRLEWDSKHLDLRAGDQFSPDFRKINPKGLVPALVHDGRVVLESNAIVQYLDEVFAASPLLSADAVERAEARGWLIRLDAGLHEHIAVISFCVAFRHQILQRHPTQESLQAFFAQIRDPSRRAIMEDIVTNGLDSHRLLLAVLAYDKLLKDMTSSLLASGCLVGRELSLADFSMLPYIERLEQLRLSQWWEDYPELSRWLARLRATAAYELGVSQWSNPAYLQLMKESGSDAWPKIQALLSD
ncbi:MAG: glutathione S-transferase family protein [Congregibacter sp.]